MNTNLSKMVVVVELDEKFVRAYRRAMRRRGFYRVLKFGAVMFLAYYIYDVLEGRYKKGMQDVLDFLMISTRSTKRGAVEVYPKFLIKKSKDLMIRGGDFYAVWDEAQNIWSLDEHAALRMIDKELVTYAEEKCDKFDGDVKVLHLWDSSSGMIDNWHKYCQKQMRDSFHPLDEKLVFANEPTKKEDYVTRTLNYPLEKGDITAYERMMSVLYSPDERMKIEWAIGAIVSGDSVNIQKFLVFYGSAGTGKSTVLNLIQKLFEGYYAVFDAKALGSTSNSFALEAFKTNPLVAIQHDGD